MLIYNGLVPVTHGLCHCNPTPVTVTYAPILCGCIGFKFGGFAGYRFDLLKDLGFTRV